MQDGKRPVTVGLFFSFGHSVIVLIMSAAIVLASATIKNYFPQLKEIGGIIGTLISAFFLFVIAAINFIVLLDIYKIFQRVKKGGSYSEESLDETLNQRGLIGRFFCPLIKIVNHSWYMFPIGILLGLGFDTATEVGLLGIAATSATQGMPAVSIMIFPILFTAGMSLIDTTDGILMLGAYGWAFLKPIRKIYYNLSITSISIMVAVFVGSIETLGLFQNKLNLKGAFWDSISYVNDDNNLGIIGFSIIGIFIVAWIGSTILYKLKKYDRL
jgi:high-affinity nickel-transport protein